MGHCHPPDGVCYVALDKRSIPPEVDRCTMLTRRQGLVCSEITVDDGMSR